MEPGQAAGQNASGTIIGLMTNMALSGFNNAIAENRTERDRKRNYYYSELAAGNADRRTRALYNDFYSPEALMRQYKEAGLSPSMMFGGTPGQGGMSGAQGSGGAGLQSPYMPASLLEAAQVANLQAMTAKTKEEAKNINTDTQLKELEKDFKEMANTVYKTEWAPLVTSLTDDEGNSYSLYDIAETSESFQDFQDKIRKMKGYNASLMDTELGQKTLRSIYKASYEFDKDIAVLTTEQVNAEFQKTVLDALNKEGFANESAKNAVQTLRAATEAASLSEDEKAAWNRLLDRFGKKGTTGRDIAIILGIMFMKWQSMAQGMTGTALQGLMKGI